MGITWADEHKDEIFTDNTKIEKYEQCKDCMFRYMVIGGKKIDDYRRGVCMIFSGSAGKPNAFFDGSAKCEYFEKE